MRRLSRRLIRLGVLGTLGVIIVIWLPSLRSTFRAEGGYFSLAQTSPTGGFRIGLREKAGFMKIDRNFSVVLWTLDTAGLVAEERSVYESPDEGRPVGTERLWWSPDGKYALLTGRHFVVEPETPRDKDGVAAYLLVRIEDGYVWSNASQTRLHQRFGADKIRDVGIEWP